MTPTVDIWTDGAAHPNNGSGFGGWGVVIKTADSESELSGSEAKTTNNRMEMMAAIKALESLSKPSVVNLRSDSKYVIDAFNKKWLVGWQKKGWKTSTGTAVKNQDLWLQLLALAKVHKITWTWVRGHAGDEDNDRCDRLAVDARVKLAQDLE
mgnify:CR=1 FL=1